MNKSIAIVSLGWLGSSVYDHFQDLGFKTCGTFHTSSKNKTSEFQYDFNNDPLPEAVINSDIVFLNLPPSKMNSINQLDYFLGQIKTKHLVFISSTSVYSDQGMVTELTEPNPDKENGKFLVLSEKKIMDVMRKFTIIRPGGLYGDDRHPGRYLAGKENIQEGDSPINLSGKKDLIRIIELAIKGDYKVINAVNSHHPLKKDYYTQYCKKQSLPLPTFIDTHKNNAKTVFSNHPECKIESELP